MAKLNFQQPLLLFSESPDPSEIILIGWFSSQKIFLIIINAVNIYFCGNHDTLFLGFFDDWTIEMNRINRNTL